MIAFPIRLDGSGRLASVGDYTPEAARQLVRAVVSTRPGERPLAPGYGIPDPTDGIEVGVIAALVTMCEPEISVRAVQVRADEVDIDAEWSLQ